MTPQLKIYTLLLVLCWNFPTFAAFNVYEFDDTTKARQFNTLIDELRCPKCQNNNLSDSNAVLASDIKDYVYQSVQAGKSNDEITDFLISRYGQFITYRPRNIWLWLLPMLIGCLAVTLAIWRIANNRCQASLQTKKIPDMETLIRQHKEEKQ